MLEFREAKKYIKKANKIYIVGHINPDGDSIGAAFSMYLALKKMGKDVDVIISEHSKIFDFLPHIDEAKTFIKEDSIDLLISLDSSDIKRLGVTEEDIKKAKNILMIDHHKKSNAYGKVNIIDETCPATCQLVYEFISYLNIKMDLDIATYIYAGILTDTGSFNYSSTNERTLIIVSKLVGLGIDFAYICKKLNDTVKEPKLKLIATAINNMEVYENGKIRYTYVDYDTICKLGVDEEDAEGMTNYLRMVQDTEVAIYVREKSNGTNKVSLRSGDKVDVSAVAILFRWWWS
ncbi:MAG: bifunctional oligoribonuclease/PAP phosphatase NrnA [Clostridia bacterium]|nr:bifunctional oligoribonuclease/PAP phosphatase NrnA [Clostridia bacterium]MDD4386669.1 bifunctional oligoribonuclease/PAP phosphatase NrnA [Clostridia bacterium]